MPLMRPPRFRAGDRVRIIKKKGIFEKGCTPRWTEEVFEVSLVLNTQPPTCRLKDFNGEDVECSFSVPELQSINQDVFRIEKVIRRRTQVGIKEAEYGVVHQLE